MRADIPSNKYKHDVIAHGKLTARQPYAHIADAGHRTRRFDGRPYLVGVVAKHHTAYFMTRRHAIGLDTTGLRLGRCAHHAVMRQVHTARRCRGVGLGLAQPRIDRRHQFATFKHRFPFFPSSSS